MVITVDENMKHTANGWGLTCSAPLLEERRRIAREIHDSVTQEFAVVIWQLRMAISCGPSTENQLALQRTTATVEAGMAHLRRLIDELRAHDMRAMQDRTGDRL
jgi:signal transduction histidine kinase